MCQIIVSPNFNLSFELIASIYKSNSDGLGFIGQGEPVKVLPKNAKEAWRFYKEHIHGRAGAMHARWRTDGEISLERVHPYTILPGKLWVMHNGVLSDFRSGVNDPESDTEKYVNQILRPLLRRAPTLWTQDAFQFMVSKQIGSGNRLVFVDRTGHTVIINRKSGYEVGQDWYANGYSFDAGKFFPDVFKSYSYGGGYAGKHYVPGAYLGTHWDSTDGGMETLINTPTTTHKVPAVLGGPKQHQSRDYVSPSELKAVKQARLLSDEEWADAIAQQELKEYFETLNRNSSQLSRREVEEAWRIDLDSFDGLAMAIGYQEHTQAFDAVVSALRELRTVAAQEYFALQQEVFKVYRDCKSDDELEQLLFDIDGLMVDTFDTFGIVFDPQWEDLERQEEADEQPEPALPIVTELYPSDDIGYESALGVPDDENAEAD